MADVILFHSTAAADAQRRLDAACEQHIQAFQDWLRLARPNRDVAEFEAEVFSATARHLVLRCTRPPRT